jgi:hypothetical protein
MEQSKFNSLAIMGLALTLITFGGTCIQAYISLEARVAVLEFAMKTNSDTLLEIKAGIKELQQQKH